VRIFLFHLLIFLSVASFGQDNDDAIPEKPEVKPLSNVVFQFDNRREDYYGERGRMNGLKLGVEAYKRVRFGVGFYGNSRFYAFDYPDRPEGLYQSFRTNYNTLWVEYIAFKGFRYEVSFPIGYGSGRSRINTFENNPQAPSFLGRDTITGIQILDLGINAHFKPIPFLGVGFGLGYRSNINNTPILHDPLTATYFDIKLKFFVGYVYKAIFKPKSIKEERAYYDYRRQERKKKRQNLFK
jgi:hypothetical protein